MQFRNQTPRQKGWRTEVKDCILGFKHNVKRQTKFVYSLHSQSEISRKIKLGVLYENIKRDSFETATNTMTENDDELMLLRNSSNLFSSVKICLLEFYYTYTTLISVIL
jgi:hypothetical protein